MMDILINTYDTMAKILLVEDEVNIASFIERACGSSDMRYMSLMTVPLVGN